MSDLETSCHQLTLSRPTPEGTKSLLQQSKKQFAKSDESGLSIVPSRMSSRLSLSTGENSRRDSIDSNASMTYRQVITMILFKDSDLTYSA